MIEYSSAPRKINTLLLMVCGVAILGIIGFLTWLSHTNDRIWESQNWPSTKGVVISTQIKIGKETAGAGPDEGTRKVYVPALEYAYSVGSQQFISRNITVDSSWGLESYLTQREADAFLQQNYPIGTEVEVFYDPGNPKDAFLFQKQASDTRDISIIMYVIIAFFGGVMIYLLINLDRPL